MGASKEEEEEKKEERIEDTLNWDSIKKVPNAGAMQKASKTSPENQIYEFKGKHYIYDKKTNTPTKVFKPYVNG